MSIQHKGLNLKFIKLRSWLSIIGVILIVAVFVSIFITNRAYDRLAYAQIPPSIAYTQPTLNPNLTERQQNILLIRKIWGHDQAIGLAIARCESGYRTTIINSIGATGLFQVMPLHGIPDMTNAVANISYSYVMYLHKSTTPWISSKGCWQ